MKCIAACGQTKPFIDLVSKLQQKLNNTVENTTTFVVDTFESHNTNNKQTRVLFNFVGKISKYLFGTSTEEALKGIRENIDTIKQQNHGINNKIMNGQSSLSSHMVKKNKSK